MRYLLLIYGNAAPDELTAESWPQWQAFNQQLSERGAFVSAQALQPAELATTVRVRNREALLKDGPFAETKEQLVGYYLLDCRDLDEAIELASKVPSVERGLVEIRPILQLDGPA